MATPVYTEEEIGKKWDRCCADALIKFGGGLVMGGVVSVLFFKKKRWPIILGTGFGIGMAYANCEKDVNSTFHG